MFDKGRKDDKIRIGIKNKMYLELFTIECDY